MPFEISNKAFEEAFGTKKKKGELTERFLEQLENYLADKKFDSAKVIRDWMKNKGKLSTFNCREDMLASMLRELRRHATPYILVKEAGGGLGFLIRNTDAEIVKKMSRHVLKEKASYCAVTTGEKAAELYLRSKEQDKQMLQISGLSEEEVLYLEESCNDALAREAVGIDRMKDGSYLFSCHGKTAINGKKGRKKFGCAVSETLVVMNGETAQKMKKQAQQTLQYREAKAVGFPDKNGEYEKPVWIVGDGDRFVKTTGEEFELCHAVEMPTDVVFETDLRVSKISGNYEKRLNAALSHVINHKCLYDEPSVYEHFRTKRAYTKSQALVGEQQLLMMADLIICEKIKHDSIMQAEGKWESKLKHYQREMSRLLVGVRDGKIPKGYTKEDILRLQKISKTYQLDMRAMTPGIEKIKNLEVFARSAEQNKVVSVERLIDKHRAEKAQRTREPLLPGKDGMERG